MDKAIRSFEDAIITLVNLAKIPIEAKRLVLKEVLVMVEAKSNELLKNEEVKETEDGTNSDC